MLSRLTPLLILVGTSTAAIAQGAYNCNTVLTNGLREYNISSTNTSYLNTLFSKYCYADGPMNSSSVSADIGIPIESIPVKFSLGASDQSQAMTNFCKTYSSSEELKTQTNSYQETIVRRAYDSFDSCVRLAALGLFVTHDIITDEKSQLLLRAGVDRPIEVNGVDTSENITCAGSDGAGKQITYDNATHRQASNTIGIFCTRKSRKTPEGVTVYDEGSVAVDITGDKYNFYWPKSKILPEDVASQVQVSIRELRTSIEGLNTKIDKTQTDLLTWDPKSQPSQYPTALTLGGPIQGTATPQLCTDGFYVVGVNTAHSTYGVNQLQVVCRKLHSR